MKIRITAFLSIIYLTCVSVCLFAADEKLPEAWGGIRMSVGDLKIPIGTPPNVTLTLRSISGNSYNLVIRTGSNEMANFLRTGKFYFTNVPFDVGMVFEIKTDAPAGSDRFSAPYTFRKPDLNPIQRLRESKALELAGYIADFHVDLATGKITHSSRY